MRDVGASTGRLVQILVTVVAIECAIALLVRTISAYRVAEGDGSVADYIATAGVVWILVLAVSALLVARRMEALGERVRAQDVDLEAMAEPRRRLAGDRAPHRAGHRHTGRHPHRAAADRRPRERQVGRGRGAGPLPGPRAAGALVRRGTRGGHGGRAGAADPGVGPADPAAAAARRPALDQRVPGADRRPGVPRDHGRLRRRPGAPHHRDHRARCGRALRGHPGRPPAAPRAGRCGSPWTTPVRATRPSRTCCDCGPT